MVTPVAGPSLGELGEEGLLARILPAYRPDAGPGARLVVGPGDDAAVLATSGATVVTTDSMTRGRDWLDAWSTAADVATKLLTQNLADVAAMGAVPTAVVVSLLADPAVPAAWAVDFADALGAAAREAGVVVAGGDLSSAGPGVVVLAMTAMGDLDGRTAVLRSGARPGDVLAVAGSLGLSGAGLWLLQQDRGDEAGEVAHRALRHHRAPVAPLAAGPAAADAGATSMVDVSDGLLRDADRVARASGVRLDLDPDLVATHTALLAPAVGEDVALECVLAGGEEHSLVATFPPDAALPDGFTALGRVLAANDSDGAAGSARVTLGGEPQTPRGWDHFGG